LFGGSASSFYSPPGGTTIHFQDLSAFFWNVAGKKMPAQFLYGVTREFSLSPPFVRQNAAVLTSNQNKKGPLQ
jgi:hypothetical protein